MTLANIPKELEWKCLSADPKKKFMKKKRRNSINTVPDSGKSERCQSWNEKE
jgi:hypothetical protein